MRVGGEARTLPAVLLNRPVRSSDEKEDAVRDVLSFDDETNQEHCEKSESLEEAGLTYRSDDGALVLNFDFQYCTRRLESQRIYTAEARFKFTRMEDASQETA